MWGKKKKNFKVPELNFNKRKYMIETAQPLEYRNKNDILT